MQRRVDTRASVLAEPPVPQAPEDSQGAVSRGASPVSRQDIRPDNREPIQPRRPIRQPDIRVRVARGVQGREERVPRAIHVYFPSFPYILIGIAVAALALGSYAAYYVGKRHFRRPEPQPLRVRIAFARDGLILNQEPTTLTNLTVSLDPDLMGAHGHAIVVRELKPNHVVAEHYTNFILPASGSRYYTGQIPSRVIVSANGRKSPDRVPMNPTNEFLRRQRSLPLDTLLREIRDPSDPTSIHVQE